MATIVITGKVEGIKGESPGTTIIITTTIITTTTEAVADIKDAAVEAKEPIKEEGVAEKHLKMGVKSAEKLTTTPTATTAIQVSTSTLQDPTPSWMLLFIT